MGLDPKIYPYMVLPFVPLVLLAVSLLTGRGTTCIPSVIFWFYLLASAITSLLLLIAGMMGAAFSGEGRRNSSSSLEPEIIALFICSALLFAFVSYFAYLRLWRQEFLTPTWVYCIPGVLSGVCGTVIIVFLRSVGR